MQWKPIRTAPKDGTIVFAINSKTMEARPSWYFAPSSQTSGWIKIPTGRYWKPDYWQTTPVFEQQQATPNT